MFGWIKAALTLGLSLVKTFKSSKPTVTDALPIIVGQLLPAIQNAINYGGLDSQAKFDAWLDTIDAATGTDASAVDFIKDLPAAQEELLFDHLKEAARIYGYCLLKVDGFHE